MAVQRVRAHHRRVAPQAAREEIQRLAFEEVPYVPGGQCVLPSGDRKNVRGVPQFGAQLFQNIQMRGSAQPRRDGERRAGLAVGLRIRNARTWSETYR